MYKVYSTSVQETSLLYKCTQNQFTVQVYTKPVTLQVKLVNKERNVHGQTILRNVQGQNITKLVLCTLLISKLVLYTLVQ